jgi:hypothetical protein
MMTEPLWWRLSAGPRFAQGFADLRFEKKTRFLLVGETMIRHASPSRTVTATSGSVHGATTWSCLIAPPSFPLVVAAGFLRAGSDAIVLAAIALPTDKNLRAAATTQKRPARHFIGTGRHINPQPSADSGRLQPRSAQACRRARACQGQALRVEAECIGAFGGGDVGDPPVPEVIDGSQDLEWNLDDQRPLPVRRLPGLRLAPQP